MPLQSWQLQQEVANLRQAQEKRIALLTSTRADAQNYLALEEKLKQTKANLKATEQNLTKLEKDAKSQAKVLQNKQTELAQLKSNLARIQQTKKENTFTLQKELRNYKLYHAREICRLAPDLKEKVTNLKSQKAQLLTTITNLESELTQKESERLALELAKQAEQAKIKALAEQFNEQLRCINLLFDPDSQWYQDPIDFSGLYQGLTNELQNQVLALQEKDAELVQKDQQITDHQKLNKSLTILANHRLELLEQEKSALVALAKQKIANKKEASELLSQLQTKWAEEKENLISDHHQKVAELEAESTEQEQLAAQEIRKLRAKAKEEKTKSLREKTQLKAVLRRLLTEQESQLETLS
jgi:hypothetical protein